MLVALDMNDSSGFYVLTWNPRLGYIGLERCSDIDPFHPLRPADTWYREPEDVFFQDPDSQLPQRKPWDEYSWHTQIRRLADRLPSRE